MNPPARSGPPDAWERWFWLWRCYFVFVLLGDAGYVGAVRAAGTSSYVSAALVLGCGLVYFGFHPDRQRPPHSGTAGRWMVGLLTALYLAACLLDANAGFSLFALTPMIFMALRFLFAAMLTSALIAVPMLSDIARVGLGEGQLSLELPVTVMLMAGSVLIGFWLERIIEQSGERAELIRQLEESREALDALAHEAGVTAERERLAGDIHDTLAQGFTSVLTLVQAAQAKLGADTPEVVHRHLDLAARTARENLTEARALIAALTPAALGAHSLSGALGRLLEDTAEQSGARTEYLREPEVRVLPTRVEVVLLRTAQEALANVRKHAGATEVSLRLSTTDESVRMVITDNGCGFDRDTVRSGYGLDGMRSRATQLGGTVCVHSGSGAGTRVELEVPL